MSAARPTLRDLARQLNLSPSTISMALKDHPRISAPTRSRVQSAAKRAGYVPDPRISNVMGYLKKRRTDKPIAELGYITNHPEGVVLKEHPIYHNYLLGARERAGELGYRLEEFNMEREHLSRKRLTQILLSRGIQGILVPPVFRSQSQPDVDLDDFATITFGHSWERDDIHRISLDHFSAVLQSLRNIADQGYRRIGFAMEQMRERVQHRWKAAHLIFLDNHRNQRRIPALDHTYDRDRFLKWFEKHKPDAILSQRLNWVEFLHDEGIVCGRDYGFATLARESIPQEALKLSSSDLRLSLANPAGLDQNSFQTGRQAIDFITQQISHNFKGLPDLPQSILIGGKWHPGSTLPRAQSS